MSNHGYSPEFKDEAFRQIIESNCSKFDRICIFSAGSDSRCSEHKSHICRVGITSQMMWFGFCKTSWYCCMTVLICTLD